MNTADMTGHDLYVWLLTLSEELNRPITVDGCQMCIHNVRAIQLEDEIKTHTGTILPPSRTQLTTDGS